MKSDELGAALGLDVKGSRARYAADRIRYRAAISAALDRLCENECQHAIAREPVPYAAGGMADPFERREVNGRGENQDQERRTGQGSDGGMAGSERDARPAGDGGRAVPVLVRGTQGPAGYLV